MDLGRDWTHNLKIVEHLLYQLCHLPLFNCMIYAKTFAAKTIQLKYCPLIWTIQPVFRLGLELIRWMLCILTSKQVLQMIKINFFGNFTSFLLQNKKEKAQEKCKKYLKNGSTRI